MQYSNEKNEYLRMSDWTYPSKDSYTTYDVVDTDTLTKEHEGITREKLKELDLPIPHVGKDRIAKGKYTVIYKFDEAEYKKQNEAYQIEQNKRIDDFYREVSEEHDLVYGSKIQQLIHQKAYDRGHSAGHFEVANHYYDYVEFFEQIQEALKEQETA